MFVDSRRERFGVEFICETIEVSPSAYYERRSGRRSARSIEDERLLELIETTHKKNYSAYGYRRTWKALLRAGERAPSAAASPGARPRPIPTLSEAPIWSIATSRPRLRTSSGSPT